MNAQILHINLVFLTNKLLFWVILTYLINTDCSHKIFPENEVTFINTL